MVVQLLFMIRLICNWQENKWMDKLGEIIMSTLNNRDVVKEQV